MQLSKPSSHSIGNISHGCLSRMSELSVVSRDVDSPASEMKPNRAFPYSFKMLYSMINKFNSCVELNISLFILFRQTKKFQADLAIKKSYFCVM